MNNIRSGQMRWFVSGLMLASLAAGAAFGQTPASSSQKPSGLVLSDALAPQSPSDKVVIKVGDDAVTQGDMDALIKELNPQAQKEIATQGRRSLGEQYATMIVLSHQAVSDHLDATPNFQRAVTRFRLQLLAQLAYQKLAQQNTVTPEETNTYFTTHKAEFDQIQLRQIIIRKKSETLKNGLEPEEAKVRAGAIRKALLAGDDIKKVAQQFQVPDVVIINTEASSFRRGSLRPDVEKSAFALKDGQVSEEYDFPQTVVLFQVAGQRPAELKDVTPQIENTIRQHKIESAMDELKKSAQIWMDDTYFNAPGAPTLQGAAKPPTPAVTPK